jgi:hypothetical protein
MELPAELDLRSLGPFGPGPEAAPPDCLRRTAGGAGVLLASFELLLMSSPPCPGGGGRPGAGRRPGCHRAGIPDRDKDTSSTAPDRLKNTGNTDLHGVNTETSTPSSRCWTRRSSARRTRRPWATAASEDGLYSPSSRRGLRIKCQNGHYLSFILPKPRPWPTPTPSITPTTRLETGREPDLRDLLGPDWKRIAMKLTGPYDERSQDPANVTLTSSDGIEGFQSIRRPALQPQ